MEMISRELYIIIQFERRFTFWSSTVITLMSSCSLNNLLLSLSTGNHILGSYNVETIQMLNHKGAEIKDRVSILEGNKIIVYKDLS